MTNTNTTKLRKLDDVRHENPAPKVQEGSFIDAYVFVKQIQRNSGLGGYHGQPLYQGKRAKSNTSY